MVFAWLQVAVALIAPAIFATHLTTFRFEGASFAQLAYWLGLPGIAFLALAFCLAQNRLSNAAAWGAALGGYLALLVPAAALLLTSGAFYRGGGANIGVALLVFGMPVLVPLVMFAGWALGAAWTYHQGNVRP